jgi:hypothetical protein
MIMLFIKLQHSAFVAFADNPAGVLSGQVATPKVLPALIQLPAQSDASHWQGPMFQSRARAVRLQHNCDALMAGTDKAGVRLTMLEFNRGQATSIPWAMQMNAVSIEEPAHLVKTLTGAILGCGGWVLSRGANDTGTVNMLFEFERQACVDIYSVLIAAGIDLSQAGHIRFTELCQCTRSHPQECGTDIASIDLEIQTYAVVSARSLLAHEAA